MCSSRTITGKFEKGEVKDNYLSVTDITLYGFNQIKYTIVADYPLKSEVKIGFAGRGSCGILTGNYDQGERWEYYDFDGQTDSTVLKVGESSWQLYYQPSGAYDTIVEINWAFDFKAFSDQYYNYKKGPEQDYYTGIIRW